MMAQVQHIGLLGGTFNPIHNGHIHCAREVFQKLQLDRVDLLPNAIPPHKASPGVSAEHRLAMVQLAAAEHPELQVDPRELNRSGNSYTADTLAEIKQQHPLQQLYFIVGMDSLLSFHKWHQFQRILELCHLVVCARPGHPFKPEPVTQQLLQQHQVQNIDQLKQNPYGGIFVIESTDFDAASTQIRTQISNSADSHCHLPRSVVEYIQRQGLYRD